MMFRKMGVPFFLMTPFNEITRLRGLLSCFLSALKFQSWTIGTKTTKRQKTQPLLHFAILLIWKKKKKSQGLQWNYQNYWKIKYEIFEDMSVILE